MGNKPEDENYDEFMNASAEDWSEPEEPEPIPEVENSDEFMNASAEDWSEPEEPEPIPESPPEPTDRWGSPIPDPNGSENVERWGSEPAEPSPPKPVTPVKSGGSKWWIIAIVAVVLLCLCVCVVLFGLPLLGISIFESNLITY